MRQRLRRWLGTINNPDKWNLDHDNIKAILNLIDPKYWCMCDEIGLEEETPHTHIYMEFNSGKDLELIAEAFNHKIHLDQCYGTGKQNRDYIRKEGKYIDDKKKETNLIDTFEESGEMKKAQLSRQETYADVMALIELGYSNNQIINEIPMSFSLVKYMDSYRDAYREAQSKEWRDLTVNYIYGKPGVGKSRYVMEKYGYDNVYRITDYRHPFDNYNYQNVIVFEEFNDSLDIRDMLKYLDGYPCQLPCRYSNKYALFKEVYILSNVRFWDIYNISYRTEPDTYNAWLRRINHVYLMCKDGSLMEIEKEMK